jgi:hypothetical protein
VKLEQFFPTLAIVINLGAAGFYARAHNWRLCVNWIAVSVATAVITF